MWLLKKGLIRVFFSLKVIFLTVKLFKEHSISKSMIYKILIADDNDDAFAYLQNILKDD